MAFKPTETQEKAIKENGCILVSAAAGSGKTAVLTERVIRKLTDKTNYVDADRLLIVTFTNAAAFEMRSRIEKRLLEECSKHPDDGFLIEQKHKLSGADICTIDSFCIKLVRENFEKCGVEPDFKVSDGSELISECDLKLSEIIDEYLEKDRKTLNKLFEITDCEFDDSNLKSIIKQIYQFACQQPFFDNFLDSILLPYSVAFDNSHPWYGEALKIAKKSADLSLGYLKTMADDLQYFENSYEKAKEDTGVLCMMIENLKSATGTGDFDNVYTALSQVQFARDTFSSKNGEIGKHFKKNREKLKDAITDLKAVFSNNSSEVFDEYHRNFPAISLLMELVKKYSCLVLDVFKENNTLGFHHTEQMAFNLLCNGINDGEIVLSDEAINLSSKYDEVLVDEFQDVNDLQNMLFYILSGNGKNLFVVGDIKQSIYRFRGSNLKNFLKKKRTYIPINEADVNDPKKIILSDNFRSRKGVCEFVNFFFGNVMRSGVGEIEYNSEERLNPAAKFPDNNSTETELLLIDKGNSDQESLFEAEAVATAEYIKNLIENGYDVKKDNETLRRAKYSDVCILIDSFSNKAPIIAKALSDFGIPVSFSNEPFCESVEISLALSLLTVLDNPQNDIELLSVMMSPIFGFTPEEMAQMRSENKHNNIYKMLIAEENNANIKVQKFLNTLRSFRNEMAIMPLGKFVSKLVYDSGLLSIVGTMRDGKNRQNNLLALSGYVDRLNSQSASDFVRKIKVLPNSSFKNDVANNESVKIMSMHKSKGLQFPICILSGLSSLINRDDSIAKIVYSEEMGLGYKYYDEEEKITVENLGRKLNSRKTAIENMEEKLRLLYVAMTRAEEKLVLVTSVKNSFKTLNTISENIENGMIDGRYIMSTNSVGNLILASSLLHPDGDCLRNLGEINIGSLPTDSKLKVTIVDYCVEKPQPNENEQTFTENAELVEKIKNNMSYEYPFEEITKIPAKTTVTEISHKQTSEEYLFNAMPSFMNESGISHAEKGTATHKVLQFIEFKNNIDVDKEIERLWDYQFIPESWADAVDRNAIKEFFRSDLFGRIINSKMYKREMRFLTELPIEKLNDDISENIIGTKIMVQGAVDLIFEENDGMVIVDFKTDRVADLNTLSNRYGKQLEIYRLACEKIFGKKIKSKIIYSFCLNKEIVL